MSEIELNMDTIAVEVRPSKVHGRGVFALRDIKVGEFVCTYDGELLLTTAMMKNSSVYEDGRYCLTHPKNPKLVLCGYKYPKNKTGVGQLVNDAKIIQLRELDYKDGIKACRKYVKESKELANVDFMCKDNFNIHAVRDIKKDEELFIHYGYAYWLGFILNNVLVYQEQFMWTLLCFCLLGEVQMSESESINIGETLKNLNEVECRKIIERMVIPSDVIDARKQVVAAHFTYHDFLWFLLESLNIDCIETYLDARKKRCNID